jgi:cell division septation protein DedD
MPATIIPSSTTSAPTSAPTKVPTITTTTVPKVPSSTQAPTACPKNDINLKAVSEQDVRNIVKQLMKENNKGYLEQEEYKEKDPLYYMNTGELIDNSWENQYSVINTKFWKLQLNLLKLKKCKD